MSVLVVSLALLGVLFIAIVAYVIVRNRVQKQQTQIPVWPPSTYMQVVGNKCPDLWTYLGTEGETNYCWNQYGLPTGGADCVSDEGGLIIGQFDNIDNLGWPITSKSAELEKTCDWIQQCGPGPHSPAQWTGIGQVCG